MKASGQDLPPFLEPLISGYEAVAEGVSPIEIWQYEYNGEPVFYVPLSRIFCCDILSELYNVAGALVWREPAQGHGDSRRPAVIGDDQP
jgi:hypothetical protein